MPPRIRKDVLCADGFSMSVQASENHYSIPRNDDGPYIAVEVGYPSREEPLLEEHREPYTKHGYSVVPQEKISLLIYKHGGMVCGERPEMIRSSQFFQILLYLRTDSDRLSFIREQIYSSQRGPSYEEINPINDALANMKELGVEGWEILVEYMDGRG